MKSFCDRKLFTGVDMNMAILLGNKKKDVVNENIFSTPYIRWNESFREHLFSSIGYTDASFRSKVGSIEKKSSVLEQGILKKISEINTLSKVRDDTNTTNSVYCHSNGRYFRKCIREQLSNEYKTLPLKDGFANITICTLSSSFYYWLWIVLADCDHVTKNDADSF